MQDKLKEMRRIAEARGGKCLSENYLNAKTYIEWSCHLGHVWPAAPDKIRHGEWCPVCANCQPHSIGLMQELAARRGGKCLSAEYQSVRISLEWRCQEGHTWTTSPASIILGSWCPHCARTARLTLAAMQSLAQRRGGRCLSASYHNNCTPLRWECKNGHQWRATAGKVKGSDKWRGTWCPTCAREEAAGHDLFEPLALEDIQRLARDRGGECLATEYLNNHTPLPFRCAAGHHWMLRAKDLKRGNWCPHCAHRARLTLAAMQQLARSRGGACRSTEYVNIGTALEWQCAEGHTWKAKPSNVLRKTWCPVCAGNEKLTREELETMARSKGGKCLSKRYVNVFTPLRWQCANGHTWKAAAAYIKPSRFGIGTWCPTCALRLRLKSITEPKTAS